MRRAIFWFRNNLRFSDQLSLAHAASHFDEVFPVVILPANETLKHTLGLGEYGLFRKKFYAESIDCLSSSILEQGGKLTLMQGNVCEQLTQLASDLDVQVIITSREVGFLEQDEERLLSERFTLKLFDDQFLIQQDELPFALEDLPFGFSSFRKKAEHKWQCRLPMTSYRVPWAVAAYSKTTLTVSEVLIDDRSAHLMKGGELAATDRLQQYLWESGKIESYKWTRNEMLGVDFSSKLSAFLALGCISPVLIWSEIVRYEAERKENVSTYWLKFELLWREFFRYVALKHGRDIFLSGGIQKRKQHVLHDDRKIESWETANTGDDFVDACMTELVKTGYLSNRGRQNAASYFIHDLGQDWRIGASFFERHLIDYDVASNWGNWMYIAGVGNDRRQHKFDTTWQANKYDEKQSYRTTWLDA
jgi:deoxyribodipyrimidine photo-lyase